MSNNDISIIFDMLGISNFNQIQSIISFDSQGLKNLSDFFEIAKCFGLESYLEFDISIVRGLSYYTGTVFETFDRERKFRAILGGGRYDNLFKDIGNFDLAAAGFGFGDVVIMEVLKHYGKDIIGKKIVDYVVSYADEEMLYPAIRITNELRSKNKSVFLLYENCRLKKAFKFSNERGAKYLSFIDEREFLNDT